MMLLVLLLTFLTSALGCAQCLSNGFAFSCGCPKYFLCLAGPDTDDTTVGTQYSFTAANRLYTQFVTTAKLIDQTYYAGPIKHSSELTLGELVIWPGFDINSTNTSVVMALEHYNISDDKLNCCASISAGFPPSCQVKFCCGSGCCC